MMQQPPVVPSASASNPTVPVVSFKDAIDQLKHQLDIIDVIGRRVELKKAGKNYSGLCPFHNEKTPSFNVNRERQIFKCFGCGESGDVFAFLMKTENQGFGELIADLAQQYGINLEKKQAHQSPEERTAQQEEQALIEQVLLEAAKYYRNQLDTPQGQAALTYLEGRNLQYSTQTNWMLGYAPSGWRNLMDALKLKITDPRLDEALLEKAGLIIKKEIKKEVAENFANQQSTTYDRFRNRLMIPIWNDKGNVVAFGARTLSNEDQPKYLNSPETELYLKHQILYGLFQAKEAIRQTKACVVMEGYFDVLSAVDKGVNNTVGICGTALSEQHLKLLRRFGAETIYLCLDSDKAGQNAIYRTLEQLQVKATEMQLSLMVMQLPDGKDPDAFFQHHTHEDFMALLPESWDGWQFQLNYQLSQLESPLNSMAGRIEAAEKIAPVLLRIEKPVLRFEWIRLMSSQIGISEESLHQEVQRLGEKSSYKNNSYYDKKNQSTQAIPLFDERCKRSKLSSKRKKGPSLLEVQEDVRTLRQHLTQKTTYAHKEAELISHLFLSTNTWDHMIADLMDFEFECPLAQKLGNLMVKLSANLRHQNLMTASVDERIQYLQQLMNQDVDEANYPEMSRYLSNRVFEADKIANLYAQAKPRGLQAQPQPEQRYLALTDLFLSNLRLQKQKQLLSNMVLQMKHSPKDQLDAVEMLLHEKMQQLLNNKKPAATNASGNEHPSDGPIQPLWVR